MTIMEALQWANNKLKSHEDEDPETGTRLDSPMLDAQILLAAVLDVQKSWLFTHFNDELPASQEEKFQDAVRRRRHHEPAAYIVGKKAFYKRDFCVNRFVLIPRPATETLVEQALAEAADRDPEATLFIDVGTGSGAIAVTLAAETGLPVIATDVSARALSVARQNAALHGVEDRIDFRCGNLLVPVTDLFEKLAKRPPLPFSKIIVCANLPYLTLFQWDKAQAEIHQHEPKEALLAGIDGLDAYFEFFRQLLHHRRLFPDDLATVIEADPAQMPRLFQLITHDFPFAEPRVVKDLEGFDRVIVTKI